MAEKRMLIVDAEVVKKIDENRGDMSFSEFINYLIDGQLKESSEKHHQNNYATRDELNHLENSLRDVLRSFLEFFLSYGLDLGKSPNNKGFADLDKKLQELGNSTPLKSRSS